MNKDQTARFHRYVARVAAVETDPEAEQRIRSLLERVARTCPRYALRRLGECLLEMRREDLRKEAEMN